MPMIKRFINVVELKATEIVITKSVWKKERECQILYRIIRLQICVVILYLQERLNLEYLSNIIPNEK